MVVGEVAGRTQLAIIGAGPGGYVAALRGADAGLEVTLIDAGPVGGTCLNVGCIPSKTLIETANRRHHVHDSAGRGLRGVPSVDMAELADHLGVVSGGLRDGVSGLLAAAGVNVVAGHANFSRPDRLGIVQGDLVSHLEFDDVIVATGSRPIELSGFPVGGHVVDSTGALALRELPERMAVIGGGYIGIELGTAYAKLGVAVTIIEATDSILPGLPVELSRVVARRLRALNIEVLLNTRADKATRNGLTLQDQTQLSADCVVVAVGRTPNSDGCSLHRAGVTIDDRGYVVVDEYNRAARGIWAIGDVVPGIALAHRASAEAETVIESITGQLTPFDPTAVPAVVFSDPEIISVGVAPAEASPSHTVHRFGHGASARARTVDAPNGLTLIVADEAGTVVGVHIAGPHASELAGEATLAIEMATTLEDLSLTIHPHPTMSESIVEAAFVAQGRPLHVRS